MKRHFQDMPAEVVRLSVEEQAILDDTNNEAEIGLDVAEADVERVAEVANVANDAVLVVNEAPELGTVEQNLVAAVSDMAVAGTDADPAEVLAVAGPTDDAMTTEGIMSALKSIWDAIVTSIKNMWLGVKHFFTTWFTTLEQNKKQAEDLIKRLDGMSGMVAGSGDVKFSDWFGYSGYNGIKMLFNGVAKQKEALQIMVHTAAELQHQGMGPIGDMLVKGFEGVKANTVADGGLYITSMEPVIDALSTGLVKYCERMGLKKSKDGYESSNENGGIVIRVAGFSEGHIASENSLLTKINNLAKVRFSANQKGSDKSNLLSIKNDVSPESLKLDVVETLKFIDGMLHLKNTYFDGLQQQSDKVQKACEAMLSRIKPENPKSAAAAKVLMPLATAYANWSTQPAVKLFSIMARHNKWWLTLYEKAANNYVSA